MTVYSSLLDLDRSAVHAPRVEYLAKRIPLVSFKWAPASEPVVLHMIEALSNVPGIVQIQAQVYRTMPSKPLKSVLNRHLQFFVIYLSSI